MSATTSLSPSGRLRSQTADRNQRPGLARLIAVELRKMVNTRSGFWVPIGVAGASLLVAIIASANHGGRSGTLNHVLHATAQPAAFLLPVIGVLLICGEWSQRTKLPTFTLVPSRSRVIAAKLGASWVASTIALVVCLVFTILCVSAFGHHPGGAGSLSWQVIGQSWLFLAATMVIGLAFGAALLTSAPAIVLYLLLPTVWSVLAESIGALAGPNRWLNSSESFTPMTLHAMSGTEWMRALATFAVWAGIPMLIGLWRIGRGDID